MWKKNILKQHNRQRLENAASKDKPDDAVTRFVESEEVVE
jgi:hypothetical protein